MGISRRCLPVSRTSILHQSSIELDSGDLTVDAVKEGGAPLDFAARARQLTIRWPRPAKVNEARQLEIAYHGAPRFGMQFFAERAQVYTVFSTSQWLVCVDAPDDRVTLNLSVVLPAGLTMVASGTLVANTVGQEMSGFSVMSEDNGRAVLADPRAESLIAHELAHQWWGNRVTCAAWTHMWLNEGFATFMSAAFMEQRFGRDEYLRTVEAWRSRYPAVREAGHDRSLIFADWIRPWADDRALVYQKGPTSCTSCEKHSEKPSSGPRSVTTGAGVSAIARRRDASDARRAHHHASLASVRRRALGDGAEGWSGAANRLGTGVRPTRSAPTAVPACKDSSHFDPTGRP
jgi:hypothetical protein